MSSFVIFDPKNNLIFSKCDESFRKILFESNGNSVQDVENENEYQEMAHNWLSIYLTPYVSTFRELPGGKLEFDLMPSTLVVQKNYQEFIFMHLICHHQTNNENFDQQSVILHQFKVNVFCQTVIFLCGNALYLVARNESIQQTLFAMIDRWNVNCLKISFMIESIEKLHVGFHIDKLCEELSLKLERMLKLEMKTIHKEIFSFCFVLYKNKLVYKFESNTRIKLKPRDLTMIMLLSQLNPDSQTINVVSNYHGTNNKKSIISLQKLIFLQSSTQIPVPHIFRKILINKDLYIVCISEIFSIMMISLPTLIQSVIDYKTQVANLRHNSKRSIHYLIKCIRSLDKYINKNLDIFPQRHLFNISSLENLNNLVQKAESRRTSQTEHLIQEQTERIITVLIDSLHQSYEKVFKTLYMETIENHFKPFDRLSETLFNIDNIVKLDNCVDFISLKYAKNVTLLNNLQALKVYRNLLAFIFVDRNENFFFEDHREIVEDNIETLYRNLLLEAYKKSMRFNRNIVFWSNGQFFYIYVCWADSLLALKEACDDDITSNGSLSNWPNLFIDEWFQSKNILKEFFAIIDFNNVDILTEDTRSCLDYITSIVNKIQWHISSSN